MSRYLQKYLRRAESAALMALAITLCVCTWAQARQESISSSLIRLHILAVSDDEAEQALKLRVRDAVLDYMSRSLNDAGNVEAAEEIILSDLQGIADAACSAAEGRKVTVSLRQENYPTRVYENFTLPAGRYKSLRIVLGEGEGHNWWCIVYPQVCLPAAQSDTMLAAMSGGDYAVISGGENYKLRLKILELWGEWTQNYH